MNLSFGYCYLADKLGSLYKSGFVSLAYSRRGLGGEARAESRQCENFKGRTCTNIPGSVGSV
jgi:hypothetical protein